MPKPGEHKTVQSRILKYAQGIGWIFVSWAEVKECRGFKVQGRTHAERTAKASLYFDDIL
jgi:type I restriction enzyme R subunit